MSAVESWTIMRENQGKRKNKIPMFKNSNSERGTITGGRSCRQLPYFHQTPRELKHLAHESFFD